MNKTVLSVNSNKSMNYLLNTIITHQHNFIPATDMYAAMKELKKNNHVNVILVDIDTQIDESLDFIQHLQTSSLFNNIAVIAITGNKSAGLRKTLEDMNIHSWFSKPFNPVDVLKSIEDIKVVDSTYNRRLSVITS